MKIALILNRDAGTLRTLDVTAVSEELAGIFRAEGHNATPVVTAGEDAVSAIRKAAMVEETDAIVVGGATGLFRQRPRSPRRAASHSASCPSAR